MTILESCLLGFLQGFTEFLPISSSGHLVLSETLLHFKASELLIFDLILHMATLFAVCIVYRFRLVELGYTCLPPYRAAFSTPKTIANRKLIIAILLSTFVTSAIGLGFKDQFEQVRDNLGVVGGSFLFTGLLLLSTLWANPKTRDSDLGYPTNIWKFALILGVMQGVAILPGVSRSGATICTALLLGMSLSRSVEYSFLMSIPVILLATVYETLLSHSPLGNISILAATIGFLSSLLSGIFFLSILVWLVQKGKIFIFSLYTIPLGFVVLGYYFWAS